VPSLTPAGNPFAGSNTAYAASMTALANSASGHNAQTLSAQARAANAMAMATGGQPSFLDQDAATPTSPSPRPTVDRSVNQCLILGRSNQNGAETYFDNRCNLDISVSFFQPGQGLGAAECPAGSRCAISIFGCGFTGEGLTFAACPKGDGFINPNGNSWKGAGRFSCRRM
jgi:hypothetical protein